MEENLKNMEMSRNQSIMKLNTIVLLKDKTI